MSALRCHGPRLEFREPIVPIRVTPKDHGKLLSGYCEYLDSFAREGCVFGGFGCLTQSKVEWCFQVVRSQQRVGRFRSTVVWFVLEPVLLSADISGIAVCTGVVVEISMDLILTRLGVSPARGCMAPGHPGSQLSALNAKFSP
jgi:hypothetical protein